MYKDSFQLQVTLLHYYLNYARLVCNESASLDFGTFPQWDLGSLPRHPPCREDLGGTEAPCIWLPAAHWPECELPEGREWPSVHVYIRWESDTVPVMWPCQ